MIKGMKLDDNKATLKNKRYTHYENSEIIRIPLMLHGKTSCECYVKEGMNVQKGMVIGKYVAKDIDLPILSSVSGKVINISNVNIYDGTLVPCVTIKNNFKEIAVRKGTKNNINNYTKSEFINVLQENAVVGMGGGCFPTYIKYKYNNLSTLIVNAVECEPYITSDYVLFKEKTEILLETIDAICEINQIKDIYIAIKENNTDLINIINDYIGTYPNIKLYLVKDVYPSGWSKYLVSEICGVNTRERSASKGIIVNNITTIYSIYKALKFNKSLTSRIVTFAGSMLKKSVNIKVKYGTLVSDVLKELKIKKGDYKLIIGGPMMGYSVDTEDIVITAEVNAVLVLPLSSEVNENECIRCGKCVSICPAKICPVLIMNNVNDREKLVDLQPERCIACGLCSYVCPSKINVREFVQSAQKKVK